MNLSANSAVPLGTWSLVELGLDLEKLRNSTSETLLRDDELQGALDRLDRIYDSLVRFDYRRARGLFENDVLPMVLDLRYSEREEGLTHLEDFVDDVREYGTQVLSAIQQDASTRQAFLVRPTNGDVDPNAILQDPYTLFGLPGRVAPQLPRACDYYLLEASRCFAVDFSFAAAILTATIVEVFLQFYFERITGRPVKRDQSWAKIEDDLRKGEESLRGSPNVLRASSRVRKLRNTIAHGDIEARSEDAVEIFGSARRAVKLMISDLIDRNKLRIVSDEAAQFALVEQT